MPNENNSGILIYAQLTHEKYIHTVFFELLTKAKELASKLEARDEIDKILSEHEADNSFEWCQYKIKIVK